MAQECRGRVHEGIGEGMQSDLHAARKNLSVAAQITPSAPAHLHD